MQHALVAHRSPPARSEPHGSNVFKVRTGRQGACGGVNVKKVGSQIVPRSGAHSASWLRGDPR
eukprot:5888326-Prymnesium_polylepis.1